MSRIVMELTNRCNLKCHHCFGERHAGNGDLPFDIIEDLLQHGHACHVDHFSFTGGEPTLHRHFTEIVRRVSGAGYSFSFVSNGSTFPNIYPLLLEHRRSFHGVTFSLDGARERTHDRLRGHGSYRQVMRAASTCVVRNLPFTFNMVITLENREEIAEMVSLASTLGSRGVRFGHLVPGSESALRLELSLPQRRETEQAIWRLQATARVPIGMAPGFYNESPFFPCGPLELDEYNVDYNGNLTLCCHLSGLESVDTPGGDIIANLRQTSLIDATALFETRVKSYLAEKRDRVARGEFAERDHFPCLYCAQYLKKGMGHGSRTAQVRWLGDAREKSRESNTTVCMSTS